MREAFQKMVKDKGFLADAKKQNLEIDPIFGDAMTKEIDKLYKTPKEIAQQVVQFRTPLSDEQKIKRKRKKSSN